MKKYEVDVVWVMDSHVKNVAGGAMVVQKGMLGSMYYMFTPGTDEIQKQLDTMKPGDRCIFLHQSLTKILNADEIEAVIQHEIGHLKVGHFERDDANEYKLSKEMEADAYAASIVGAKHVANALNKLENGRPTGDTKKRIDALGGADPLPMSTETKILLGLAATAIIALVIKKAMD